MSLSRGVDRGEAAAVQAATEAAVAAATRMARKPGFPACTPARIRRIFLPSGP